MKIVNWSELSEQERNDTLARPATSDNGEKARLVADIIANIRNNGDQALREYSAKFDRFTGDHLKLTDAEIDAVVAFLTSVQFTPIEK